MYIDIVFAIFDGITRIVPLFRSQSYLTILQNRTAQLSKNFNVYRYDKFNFFVE